MSQGDFRGLDMSRHYHSVSMHRFLLLQPIISDAFLFFFGFCGSVSERCFKKVKAPVVQLLVRSTSFLSKKTTENPVKQVIKNPVDAGICFGTFCFLFSGVWTIKIV